MEKKRVELLAPAGSFESMKAAVAAGADAVYMGGTRFGARAYADNPEEEKLLEAIDYVHLHGSRLYMTVNTLFKEEELGQLVDYMMPYYRRGLDGVIVQDLGALKVMREHFPGMELHASTQMTITSAYGAKMLKELGCCRVVTARELSLDEIRRIHREVDVELESFVHGALCYCYSGQCLMSSLIGGRSGNRGRCAQPCRLPYTVFQGDQTSAVLNRRDQQYVMSLKDLCTLDILPQIMEAGVYSMKIEGRMKSPRYTAGVVSIYRKYVDRYMEYGSQGYYVEPEDRKLLLDLFDRGGFTSGYYQSHNGKDMVALKERPEFREANQQLFDYLDKTYVEKELKEAVTGHVELEKGAPASFTLIRGALRVRVTGQEPQAAKSQPMAEEKVLKQLNRTGNTPFYFESLTADIKGSLFMPVQALNELRRDGLEALREAILGQWERSAVAQAGQNNAQGPLEAAGALSEAAQAPLETALSSASFASHPPTLTASVDSQSQLQPILDCGAISTVYIDSAGFQPSVWRETVDWCHESGKQCWLMLPRIFRSHAMAFFSTHAAELKTAGFDGLLVRAMEEVQWLCDTGLALPYALDASVYAWNSVAVSVLKQAGEPSPAFLTMPWELNSRELKPVADACRAGQIPAELIIYGHAPMMVSAQCITRTVKSCHHEPGLLYMKDRTGAMLPVKNDCAFCYNTIFNPLPVSLLGNETTIERLGIGRLRLSFTIESPGQQERILEAFTAAFIRREAVKSPIKDYTRGHFKRGVE